MQLKVKRISEHATLPTRATPDSAGFDLYASEDAWLLPPYKDHGYIKVSTQAISTGLTIEIPQGYFARILPRSGLALKGVVIGAGVIDSDFRGELKVVIHYLGTDSWTISKGDRIAQLIILPLPRFEIVECEDLDDTTRGNGGFGSTGK